VHKEAGDVGNMIKRNLFLLKATVLLIFFFAVYTAYKSYETTIGIQPGTLYRQYKTAHLSLSELIKQMIIPIKSDFLISILDIFPHRFFKIFLSESWAYSISVSLVYIISVVLFYKITRRSLKFIPSLFLTSLLFLTPNDVGFHQYLTNFGTQDNGISGFHYLNFPFPVGVIFGLTFFAFFAGSQSYEPRIKYQFVGLALVLQVYIHPLSAAICGTWVIWDYFKNPGSPSLRQVKKLKFFLITIFSLLLTTQAVTILISSGQGTFGGFTGTSDFEIPRFDILFFGLLPVLLIQLATKVINISWYEIISRFSFIVVLFLFKGIAILFSLLLNWDNPYEVLARNGYIDFIDILVFIPVIFSLLSFERLNKILQTRSKFQILKMNQIGFFSNCTFIVLITLLFFQAVEEFPDESSLNSSVCIQLGKKENQELQNLATRQESQSISLRQEDLKKFIIQNFSSDQYEDFLSNPFGASNLLRQDGFCGRSSLGYLLLNGFNQDALSKDRISELLRQLDEVQRGSIAN
jgi:hypothetical protein